MEENQNPDLQETTQTDDLINDQVPIEKVVFRHPQQILTNKEIQLLLSKNEEDLDETEKGALKLFFIRARHHNSRPKALSVKERTHRKKKRRMANVSRKANR